MTSDRHMSFIFCRSGIFRRSGLVLAATLTSALALSACASDPKTAEGDKVKELRYDSATQQEGGTNDVTSPAKFKSQDFIAAAAYWGDQHDKNPDDVNAAVRYSKALRQIGSLSQALDVMQRMQGTHGSDPQIMAESGKVLTANGKPDMAVTYLDRAEAQNPSDWTILSANGVAHDQLGRYAEAQSKYLAALKLAPNNSSILSNLGLSYALAGDLDNAEKYLRIAVANPAAGATARQNLAIVMGLKGNFDEATRLAQADLPANIAANNIAYLREMLTQPALWKQMESLDKSSSNNGPDAPSVATASDTSTGFQSDTMTTASITH